MKKLISIGLIVLFGLGCGIIHLQQKSYANFSRQVLEEKSAAGDLQAAFWLGDNYFLGKDGPKDAQKAFSNWNTVIVAVEKDPSIVSQPWFKKAYRNHHPVAVTMMLFSWGNLSGKSAVLDEPIIEQLGTAVDSFLLSKKQYPQYTEFFIKAQDFITTVGKLSYVIGQKYYDEQKEEQEVYLWANRACELQNKEGCILALKTF